jgi:archaellum biogenesis ATPase FlaH
MDILREVVENEFLLILLNESQYTDPLKEIIKTLEKTKTRICYVCLSKPYKDVINELKSAGVDTDKFFFIDVLSSHYKEHTTIENCIFLSAPVNLDLLWTSITKALKGGCNAIILDTVSSLLIYHDASEIVRFTHDILTEEKKAKKIFVVLKEQPTPEDNRILVEDLDMFADKKIDMST